MEESFNTGSMTPIECFGCRTTIAGANRSTAIKGQPATDFAEADQGPRRDGQSLLNPLSRDIMLPYRIRVYSMNLLVPYLAIFTDS